MTKRYNDAYAPFNVSWNKMARKWCLFLTFVVLLLELSAVAVLEPKFC